MDAVAKSLKKYGYDAAPIHGDLEQSQRTRTLDGFRNGDLKFLVASDVAARGLDVPAVSHVFNYDVPGHPEDYVHRIGRTGRAGLDGKALMICNPKDEKNFAAIEALLQKDIPRLENPVTPSTTEETERNEATEGSPDKPAGKTRSRSVSRKKAATPKESPAAEAEQAQAARRPNPSPRALDRPRPAPEPAPAAAPNRRPPPHPNR